MAGRLITCTDVPFRYPAESIMVFNPPEAEADRSRKRPWRAPTRTASTEQIHIPWPFKLYGTGGYAMFERTFPGPIGASSPQR